MHGIDLAVVTGQHHIDEDQASHLLTAVRSMDFDSFRRPGMFDGPRPVASAAPTHRQLLAFPGRADHVPGELE